MKFDYVLAGHCDYDIGVSGYKSLTPKRSRFSGWF
jgi:hypothetical protein